MRRAVPAAIVAAALQAAQESECEFADVPLDAIARQAGISRSTLYRRIGSRRALEDAVRAAGVDPGSRPDVRERAVPAAAAIIRAGGLQALTLDAVAAKAGCSVPALHSQLGGREGLLAALFERYSPLPRVEQVLAADAAAFPERVRTVYTAIYDAATAEPALVGALLADVLGRPDGPSARQLMGVYLPRLLDSAGRWLSREVATGHCRPLPLPLLLQLLAGPMVLHVATRGPFERVAGMPAPSRDETIDLLTAAYCRAVALPPSAEAGSYREGLDEC